MNSTDQAELRRIRNAVETVGFGLWAVFPTFILGWLVSAVARHPAADKELATEPVYQFIIFWQGGINSLPPVLLLIVLFIALFTLSFILRKTGYAYPEDGMGRGRMIFRKFLVPVFLGASAFGCGVISGGSLKGLIGPLLLLLIYSVFAMGAYYFTDTTEEL